MKLRELYGGRKLGRPTKYKAEYCQELSNYFLDAGVLEKMEDDSSGRGSTSTHYEAVRLPSLLGFAAKTCVKPRPRCMSGLKRLTRGTRRKQNVDHLIIIYGQRV